MELSGAVLEGLAACGEEAHFNKQAFALLVEGAIKICLRQSTAAEAAQGTVPLTQDSRTRTHAMRHLSQSQLEKKKNELSSLSICLLSYRTHRSTWAFVWTRRSSGV